MVDLTFDGLYYLVVVVATTVISFYSYVPAIVPFPTEYTYRRMVNFQIYLVPKVALNDGVGRASSMPHENNKNNGYTMSRES
jgi:hypothetical protein